MITWLPVGGIERKIVDVLPRLDRERFEVSLVCTRERGPLADELDAAGIPVEVIPFRSRWDPRALGQLRDLMRRREIDVVHSHMYRSNVPATVAARRAGVRRVWCQIHNVGTWETRRQLFMDRFLCRWREGMIAVSEEVQREAMRKLRLPESRVRVIYNGVDTERFSRETDEGRKSRVEIRQAEGINEGDVVFLMAARMVEQKRPQDFIDLAQHCFTVDRRGKKFPEVYFWMLGDGPMLEAMKQKAAQTARPERIKFFGRRDDVQRFMAAADIFIMTSTKEGFSNALLEAMASGLVPIVTDVGGNGEAVRECCDGRVLPPLQLHKFCSATDRILGDANFRAELAASATRRAREFSIEAMVRNVENLYTISSNSK